MASLSLKHIYKVYDGNVKAVNDFNMDIDDKEFIVFVGPSGCGKSTTLRMIAGLEEITAGELMIGDEVVNDVEPKDRNIAMVFQNYALYPHMTVRENLEFSLKLKKLPKDEIDRKVTEAAEILDITQYLDRKPRALSGGQRQRVSLGRAIVRSPKVFLLDEPLSNLDAKLRAQMRTEISKLHDKLQTTFIYVTHDQVEAMTMGTRIVVMKLGYVQQIDTPQNLYKYPCNVFVAGFIGTPQMNFFNAKLKKVADNVLITFANNREIVVPAKTFLKAKSKYFDGNTEVIMGIRPEDLHVDAQYVEEHPNQTISLNIGLVEDLGSEKQLFCELDPENENSSITDASKRLVVKADPRLFFEKGADIKIAFDADRIHLFDAESEQTILPRIPENNELKGSVSGGKLKVLGSEICLPEAISLSDGEYDVIVPSDAIIFDAIKSAPVDYSELEQVEYEPKFEAKRYPVCAQSKFNSLLPIDNGQLISAKVVNKEIINKQVLLELSVNGNVLFAVAPADCDVDNVNISIDLKKVVFAKNDQIAVSPLVDRNVLSAHLVGEKAGKKLYNFLLNVEGTYFPATKEVSDKLITAAGRKVFDINLSVDFSPYGVQVVSDGLPCKVKGILDYGIESFAVLDVNGKEINMHIPKDTAISVGDDITVAINPFALGIVDSDRDIRVI